MAKMICFRFWNAAGENIRVVGQYNHFAYTLDEAREYAEALLQNAVKLGAVEVDFDNDFYAIEND